MSSNKLYFGDNLDVLRNYIRPESVDLIYLDPPFNSAANYNLLFQDDAKPSEAQAEAFRDTWNWSDDTVSAYEDVMRSSGDIALVLKGLRSWIGPSPMLAYLSMMAARLLEMRHALKQSGSIYLHCDPNASHYIKIMMDSIFGPSNFRNEIVWKRTSAHSGAKRFGPVHDTILFYTASDKYIWNKPTQSYNEGYLATKYRQEDARGRYRLSDLTGSGVRTGDSGKPWHGFDPTPLGRHWGVPAQIVASLGGDKDATTQEKLSLLDKHGYIYWTPGRPNKPGFPQLKRYLIPGQGQPVQDVIDDIAPINSMAKERLGYPTQKPVALLERLIAASSSEGDVVLDPFCGCGTSVEAAEKLGRKWIGIDVTHYAITLIESRLRAKYENAKFEVKGRPLDLASARDLARRDKHQFQWWAAWRLGSQTYREDKKGADRGIDGNIFFKNGPYGDGRIIVSVKGGDNVGVQMVRDLRGVIEREEAELGVLITLVDPTSPMTREAVDAGFLSKSAHGRLNRIQIVTVENMLAGSGYKLPPLPVPERKVTPSVKKRDANQLELLLPFAGEKVVPTAGTIVDPRFVELAV